MKISYTSDNVTCEGVAHCSFARACSLCCQFGQKPIRKRHLAAGEAIQVEGESKKSIYYIEHGFSCIEMRNGSGSIEYLSFNGAGEAINVLQAFASESAEYRIVALSPLVVCELVFSSLYSDEAMGDLMTEMVDALSRNTQSLVSCLWMLYGESVRDRILRFLVIAGRFCEKTDDGKFVLGMSQDSLALAVRATRASVSKEISALEAKGVLKRSYGKLVVDAAKLPSDGQR